MALNLYIIRAQGTNPYQNLALESCLAEAAPGDGVILYLWQNRRTVVIGKNQSAWSECRVEKLEGDGGFLARRPSGGGAVFHDLGNLNFSFIAKGENYNVGRQLDVLIAAVGSLGISAQRSGRNDVLAGGRKFSGNAFLSRGENHCHHGTIMVDVDTDQLSKYLNVSDLKLKSKGVASVGSRVCNLIDLRSNTGVAEVDAAMADAFERVYGNSFMPVPKAMVDAARLRELTELYASWNWRFGRRIPFTGELRHRFEWGEVSVEVKVNSGIIEDAICCCDSLDTSAVEGVADALTGRRYEGGAMSSAILDLALLSPERADKLGEIAGWLASAQL